MALKLFNTLDRTVTPFKPLDPSGRKVGMYCCGPTVHDYAHIGNFRTFILSDLVRRYLGFKDYEVLHVMNITDVEDKIIARVKASGESLGTFTQRHEKAFLNDLRDLQCLMPNAMPRATEHMASIIELITHLMKKGMAYAATDGSVYFSIKHYQEAGHVYGQLATLDFEHMRPGERIQSDEYAKDSVADFALWKARTDADGDVYWDSPWGEGRPGWHVECSAMSMQYLGNSFDLHLGGEDLVFPHHEDEIAQSEGACSHSDGCRFVNHWVHGSHLLVEGKKMSKSLGNFFTLRQLLDKGFTGREIRFVLTSAHYRETFNFTLEGVHGARKALGRLDACITRLKSKAGDSSPEGDTSLVERFEKAMDDDLNVSAAWAAVFEWVREMNRQMDKDELTPTAAAREWEAWQRIDTVLGIGSTKEDPGIPGEIQELAEQRKQARQTRNWTEADRIRDQLKALGWVIEDTPEGPRPKKI
ncbi:MAG: cysteine--tRNA ligase [Verrucomicrobiota bacterium]|nr:cysteine--tRNA ligase [Verrucomicrobiota bacterium]